MTRLSALLASLALALTLAPSVALAADPGWPRTHTAGGYTVEVFQPQVEKWTGYQVLEFRAALSVATAGQTEPAFGIVVGTAKTQVDWNARQVAITEPKWTSITFPGATGAVADSYVAAVRLAFPEGKTQEIALDRVIANLQRTQEQQRPVEVNLDPPPIFYRSGPALLVVFTGPPAMKPLAGTSLLFATNTNWTVLLDTSTALYYLLDDDSWLTAPDLVNGPWTAATSLPGAFYSFPDDGNWTYARAHMPGHLPAVLPSVVASTQPAELIVTTGAPQMMTVAGTDLLYVTNTSSDVFLDYANGTYYFLTAGRWFSAKELNGPWSAATKSLPASFAKIPLDSPKARVLASVPGTPQAAEAVLQASIPHTAKVDPANTTITVPYQGAPVFAPVAGSENVAAASNTSYSVFEVGGGFYCCHAGIWFQAMAATGPWAVCTKVPPAIYSIPATSPYHEVTYCYVYDASPTSVTVGYTSGYTGAYVAGGLLMFGAGYWAASAVAADTYAAWHYPASYYSYGTAAHYDYYAGAYTRGAAYYGPYGGAGYGAQYNPATGTYARGATAYGPYGGSASAVPGLQPLDRRDGARRLGQHGLRQRRIRLGLQPVHGTRRGHGAGERSLRLVGQVGGLQRLQLRRDRSHEHGGGPDGRLPEHDRRFGRRPPGPVRHDVGRPEQERRRLRGPRRQRLQVQPLEQQLGQEHGLRLAEHRLERLGPGAPRLEAGRVSAGERRRDPPAAQQRRRVAQLRRLPQLRLLRRRGAAAVAARAAGAAVAARAEAVAAAVVAAEPPRTESGQFLATYVARNSSDSVRITRGRG